MNNHTKIELLIDLVKGMEYRDDDQLEAFLAQASVTIRNIFGWSNNKYWPYFENIRFKPASFFASDYEYQKSWRRGKRQMIDLMTSMLTDPSLEDQPYSQPAIKDVENQDTIDEEETERVEASEVVGDENMADATQVGDTSIKKEVSKILEGFEEKEDNPDEKMDTLIHSLNQTIEDFKKTVVEDLVRSKQHRESIDDKALAEEVDGATDTEEETLEKMLDLPDYETELEKPHEHDNTVDDKPSMNRFFDTPVVDEDKDKDKDKEPAEVSPDVETEQFEEAIDDGSLGSAIESADTVANDPVKAEQEKPSFQEPVFHDNADDTAAITRERIFLVPGQNDVLNAEVYRFLSGNNIHLVVADNPYLNRRSIHEQFNEFTDIKYAIVLMTGDHYMFPHAQSANHAHLVVNQQVAFQLGYLVGKLGRERVLGLYEEQSQFKLPTAFFDVFYVAQDQEQSWQMELERRLLSVGVPINRPQKQLS